MQLGAKEGIEQCVGARRLRAGAVRDEHTPHAESRRGRRRRPHVIRLHTADRDQRIGAAGTRLRSDEAKLPNFVAPKSKGNRVVTLDEDPRCGRSESGAQTSCFVERGRGSKERFGGQRRERRERGSRHRPAVADTGYSGNAPARSRTSARTALSTF